MTPIAKVVSHVALDREFDYLIPEAVREAVTVGSRVVIPFGRTKITGFVVGLAAESKRGDLKSILSVADPAPLLDDRQMKLARWIGDYYCCPVEQVLRTVLPGAVRRPGAQGKQQLHVVALAVAGDAPAPKLSPKQSAVWDALQGAGERPLRELMRELGVTESPVRGLARKGLVSIQESRVERTPLGRRTILPTEPLPLMASQSEALARIREAIDADDAAPPAAGPAAPRVVLLHGVTGSGKTEVYLQAIAHVDARGGGAIVLVPEISLTPQTVERFVGRFGAKVAVLHSHLSEGERYDEWHRIRSGAATIVVGARSAVFAPVAKLGLLVVDEEHEPSYKQEEAPRYNARDVAVMRGRIAGCAVVLGSATPSLESWMNVQKGKYGLAALPKRVDGCSMPVVRIVDMRLEAERAGQMHVLSKDLVSAIGERLRGAEQTILFLNRRGYASSIVCPKCGHTADCGQCSVSYTYHRHDERLRCHLCGDTQPVPAACPGCGDPSYKFAGIGTQRVERVVARCFPHARIQRMDADVTRGKDAYDRILGDFRAGRIDILIGTQMIAKGLHFPNVTLVGVVYADMSLHVPDFRAGERTFQLLAQVAGRAGRGHVPGEVIVQTYTPFHVALQAARRMDFEGFSDQEIEFRRELRYPPFGHIVCVTLRGRCEERVACCSERLARELRAALDRDVTLSEPTPAPLARIKGVFRYQVILRAASTIRMTRPLKTVLAAQRLPGDVRCAVDVDALNLM